MYKYYKFVSDKLVEKDFSLSDTALAFAKDAGFLKIYKVDGAPKVDGGYVSVTHSGNRAYIAFSDRRIGIDCEYIRTAPPRLSEKFALTGEAFFEEWTKREALAKAEELPISKMLGDISGIAENYITETFKDDGFIVTVAYEK